MAKNYYKKENKALIERRKVDTTAASSYTIRVESRTGDLENLSTPKYVFISRADDYGYQSDLEDCTRPDTAWSPSTQAEFNATVQYISEFLSAPTLGTLYYKFVTADGHLTVYVRTEPLIKVLYALNIYSPSYGYPYAFATRSEKEDYDVDLIPILEYYTVSNQTEFNSARTQLAALFT